MGIINSDEVIALKGFIDEYHILVKSICLDINKKEANDKANLHLFMFLERLMYGWRDIEAILVLDKEYFNSMFSVPILVRALINDCITIQYLDSKLVISNAGIIVDSKECLEVCKDLNGAFLNAIYEMNQILGSFVEDDYKGKWQRVKDTESDYFEPGSDKPKYKRLIIKDAFEKLLKKKNESVMIFPIDVVYYHFKYFSQYEHCSPFTKEHFYTNDKSNFINFYGAFLISVDCSQLILTRIGYHGEKFDNLKKLYIKSFQYF